MSNKNVFSMRASVLAVQAAVVCMAAIPAVQAQELNAPINSVEIGISSTDKASYQFGEYNGLQDKGAKLIGNIELNGGAAATANRFRLVGQNLGLENRSIDGQYRQQGLFQIDFGYDELLKNRSDSYQTPYIGSGTGLLTLPGNWETNRAGCAVNSTATGNTNLGGASNATPGTGGCGNYYINQATTAGSKLATPVGNAGALTAAELAAFHNEYLDTKRTKTKLGLQFKLTPQWSIGANARHEEKKGAQAIGQAIGGAAANSVTVANPIDYVTNEFDVKLAYASKQAFAELGYTISKFDDQIKSLTYQNPWFNSATESVTATGVVFRPFSDFGRMATAPSNQMEQFSFNGGYNFGKTTKLVAFWSSSKNTQDEAYLPAGTGPANAAWIVPLTSFGGEVATTNYGLKFTARPIQSLNLGAGYKFDERQNNSSVAPGGYRTPFNPQDGQFNAATGAAASTAFPYNLAYSRKMKQTNADADWAFSRGQNVKLGLEKQDYTRWCNNLPTGILPCVNASDTSENSTKLEYRNSMLENVSGRIALVTAKRTASAYGPDVAFYNADILTRFSMTDRQRDKVRASVNFQPSDVFDLTVGYESNKDKFTLGRNPVGFYDLGLDSADSTVFNLDATYRFAKNWSVNAFYTNEDISQMLKGSGASNVAAVTAALAALPGGAFWYADLKDKTQTFGVTLQANELMGGNLDLSGSYLSSRSSSPYAMSVGSYLAYSSGALPGVAAQVLANTLVKGAVTGFPDTYANTDTVSLTAKYKLSKQASVKVSFLRETLSSSDPAYYNGYQVGAANATVSGSATAKVNGVALPITNVLPYSTLLPTNELAPNYTVNTIGVSYLYSF